MPARDGRRSPAMRRGIVRVFLPVHGASPVGGDVGEDLKEAVAVAACDEVREGAGEGRVVAFEEGAVDGVERIEPAAAVEEPVACGPAKELSQIAAECTEYVSDGTDGHNCNDGNRGRVLLEHRSM